MHADAAAEMPMVIALLGGSVDVASLSGTRTIAAAELFAGPMESTLDHDEIALGATFPALGAGEGVAFEEIARRHGDYALVGVGAVVRVDGEAVASARLGYLSVSDVPTVVDVTTRWPAAWSTTPTAPRASLRARAARPADDLHASAAYRAQLVRVLTARVLRAAYDDARSSLGSRGMSEELLDVRLTVNGVARELRVPARRLLSDALRHDLGLTGTHVGCEHGVCGACTVLRRRRADALLPDVRRLGGRLRDHHRRGADRESDGSLGPVQQAFAECHGLQCGFCTPGFLTTIAAGLRENADPTRGRGPRR